MLKHTILIALTVGCLVNQGDAFFGNDGFSKLNDYLVDKEKSPDPTKNMALVTDILNGEGASQRSGSLVKAATMFTEMALIEGKCDRESVEVLRRNVEATKGAGHSTNPPLRRVDNLVYQYALHHAKECPEVYQRMAASKTEMMEPETSRRVDNFSFEMAEALRAVFNRFKRPREVLIRDIFDRRLSFKSVVAKNMKDFALATLNSIKKSAEKDLHVIYTTAQVDEKRGTLYADRGKLKELFDDYVIHPCKSYTDAMADIFDGAEFDAEIYDIPYQPESSSREMRLFKVRWQTSLICKLVDKDMANSLLSEMVHIIH